MSIFRVDLKKIVDDSYDIIVDFGLQDKLVEDLVNGLLGNIKKLAIITDSVVNDLYAKPISDKLINAGFSTDIFVFPEGEKSNIQTHKFKVAP